MISSQRGDFYNPTAKYDSKLIEFGLVNNRNQFNCFANSVLQIIWHVEVLKDSI